MELDPNTLAGGGEVQLAASRDVAVAQPIHQPKSQPACVMVDVWRMVLLFGEGMRSVSVVLFIRLESQPMCSGMLLKNAWLCWGWCRCVGRFCWGGCC